MTTPTGNGPGPPGPPSADPPLVEPLVQYRHVADFGHNLYIAYGEWNLWVRWLAVPHPEIEISCFLSAMTRWGHSAVYTQELEAEVAATISEEQRFRFHRIAERLDIYHVHRRSLEILDDLRETVRELEEEASGEIDPMAYDISRRRGM